MSGPNGQPAAGEPPGAPDPGCLHKNSFKLRFAQQRELGRSDVSLVKPFGLPATVTDKFYRRAAPHATDAPREAAALQRLHDMFALGPRQKYPRPLTSAHEYGWHRSEAALVRDPRLQHHVRDSAWLKARVRVLHADAQLKQH